MIMDFNELLVKVKEQNTILLKEVKRYFKYNKFFKVQWGTYMKVTSVYVDEDEEICIRYIDDDGYKDQEGLSDFIGNIKSKEIEPDHDKNKQYRVNKSFKKELNSILK